MFSTPTNRVARTITRSAIATAMVAPILTFGAQAAMAGGDPDPMVGNVKTDVVYDCKGSALNLVPVLTNTGAPRTVRLFVRSNEADKVVFFEDFDLTDQFSVSLPVSTNDTYLVTVTESVAGLGTPSQVSYKQDFIVPKSCSTNHNFTTSAVSSCAGLTPIIAGTVTNTGDSSDAYTVKGIGGNGNDISKILVIPSGATANWNLPISQTVAVSSNAVVATKQLGPFIPVPCAVAPSDGGSGEGPKDAPAPDPTPAPQDTVPSSTPNSDTTGTKPTLPPPATVPPTVATVPPTVVTIPPTVVPDTVPTTVTPSTLPAQIGTPQSSFEEIPAMAEIPEIEEIGLPVRVLGEIVTAQPAQVGSDAPLAFTGGASTTLATAAAALMTLGSALVAVTRRSRHRA